MKFKVYCPGIGEEIDDAVEFDSVWDDIEDTCECACEYLWDHCDGWEYLENGTAIIVSSIDNSMKIKFEISIDYEPSFGVHTRSEMEM